jgi:hypothetical protein
VSTTPEWEQVLELALIWCVLGFLWSALRKRKPIASFLSMAEISFCAIAWAMMMVFRWRVLQVRIASFFAAGG